MPLESLFGKPRVVIGMVHLGALPGSPHFAGSLDQVVQAALADARLLEEAGLDGVVVENFGDVPFYSERVPPETIAAMAVALAAIGSAVRFPIGANVLRNDARAALGLCAATRASFVRVNVHVGASVTDQGLVEGRAAETLRERSRLWAGAPAAAPFVFADVDVKHARALGDSDLARIAEDTYERGGADVLLVTGSGTGKPASFDDVRRVRQAVPDAPVLVASGVTDRTVTQALQEAHGAIVGTWLKRDGRVGNPVDPARARALVAAARA
jgi:membrane complex biogenesis BtpA family protein